MSVKSERQKAVLETVAKHAVATQSELKDLLKSRGIDVDQATISRDIKELGLVKVSDDLVHYRYSPVEAVNVP